ncbi:MAG: hypothetical protein V2A58_12835 [Planctomycetota bacterium]
MSFRVVAASLGVLLAVWITRDAPAADLSAAPSAKAELSPRQRQLVENLREALGRLGESLVCPVCAGSGVNEVAMPQERVRRGELGTRFVLCERCLGVARAPNPEVRARMRAVATLLRALYPQTLSKERAREVELALFDAQARLRQDAVFEKLRRDLARSGLWTLDARERAVAGLVNPVRIALSIPTPRLKEELAADFKRLALPLVFDDRAPAEGVEPGREVEPPEAVTFDTLDLKGLGGAADAFRGKVVAYLRHLATVPQAPASRPASAPAGSNVEAPASSAPGGVR